MNIRVILEWDEQAQSFSATCPELNFVSSCGDTKDLAVTNLREAIELLLTSLPDHLLETNTNTEQLKIAI